MDDRNFDAMSRSLAGAMSRRSGLAALAALIGSPAVQRIADTGMASAAGRARGPKIEGPCGEGKRKDNVCTKDSECCSGICNTALGKKNRDGKGRCRCVKKAGSCSEDRNCCGGRACTNGICGLTEDTPVGEACVNGQSYCAYGSTCQAPTANAQTQIGAGPFCSWPVGGGCDHGNNFSSECHGGWCAQIEVGNYCGNYEQVDVCTAETNSCQFSNYWYTPGQYICVLTYGGLPAMVPSSAQSTTACQSDTICGADEFCFGDVNQAQCPYLLPGISHGKCVPGKIACTQDSDCPARTNLTLSGCTSNACVYV
jgi:hypothetical protein